MSENELHNSFVMNCDFKGAVLLLAKESTKSSTGHIRYSHDQHDPELGRHAWLGNSMQ
jgi:hypothetical protein